MNLTQLTKFLGYKGRIVLSNLVIILAFILGTGCAQKPCETIIRTEQVFVPTPCDVELPRRPTLTKNRVENAILITKYTDELEMTLHCCTQSPKCVSK